MNILAVGAHPDDLEILCGGTLAKYAKAGHNVTMAVLTNGNMGHPDIAPPEMARIRKAELENAAAIIGAKTIWMDIDDEMSVVDLESRLAMVDVLREAAPDVVLTHSPDDYHVDHRNTSQLVFEAAPLACVHNIKRALPQVDKQPLIYYFDTLGGVGFMPTEYVDITSTMEAKLAMYYCHKSQDEWMRKATGFDIGDVIESVAKVRGYAAGVKYAEGFTKLDAWYRGTTSRILP
ncbi:MAG: PIG-L family deacetylase [Defluviitaleaceae bacterium]|nr:PIG-L family deacetylase [Defluviitaleaceae bacterium]